MLTPITKTLKPLFLPYRCILCDSTCVKWDLCEYCVPFLPTLSSPCQLCATPLPNGQTLCGKCSMSPPPFDRLFVPMAYDFPLQSLIQKMKFSPSYIHTKILGQITSQFLKQHYEQQAKPRVIIPIPLHSKRLAKRGFNQALEISRPISRSLNIKIDYTSFIRSKATKSQAELKYDERSSNIRDAFTGPVNYKKNFVAVVDDVITTGATVNEFCKTLKRSGVEKIHVWCIAKRL